MNAYEAILAAADHIERFPQSYNFNQGQVVRNEQLPQPNPYGSGGYPACMLAKIGEYAGCETGIDHSQVARHVLGLNSAGEFYHRIREASPKYRKSCDTDAAVNDKQTIPAAMREVAKDFIPKEVRAIFAATGSSLEVA